MLLHYFLIISSYQAFKEVLICSLKIPIITSEFQWLYTSWDLLYLTNQKKSLKIKGH